MSFKTKRIAALAFLIALEVVLSRFLSLSLPTIKIGFAFLPLAVAGILYGPLWAGAAGAAADVLGALLFPIGAYFPGFTLTQFLCGCVYGFFLYNRPYRMNRVNLSAMIVCILLNLGLDSLWLYYLMRDALVAMMPVRALRSVVMVFVQVLLISLFMGVGKPVIEKTNSDWLDQLRLNARRLFAGDKGQALRGTVSGEITRRALALPQYKQARTVFCFVGTAKELDTEGILAAAFADGKQVCVPLTEPDGVMTARRILSLEDLVSTGSFGILEPSVDAPVVDAADIDIAFIPCSAADRRRNRIGKGGGYYDRYLSGSAMYKAALCPSALQVARLPAKKHDVPVDIVLSEKTGY